MLPGCQALHMQEWRRSAIGCEAAETQLRVQKTKWACGSAYLPSPAQARLPQYTPELLPAMGVAGREPLSR